MRSKKILVLKNKLEFENIIKSGKKVDSKCFRIWYRINKLKLLRFGIGASHKIFKTAVLRNKLKRQCREIIRDIKIIKAIDIVVIIKERFKKSSFNDNYNEFISLYNTII
jgi:ribonuclease P protein component